MTLTFKVKVVTLTFKVKVVTLTFKVKVKVKGQRSRSLAAQPWY